MDHEKGITWHCLENSCLETLEILKPLIGTWSTQDKKKQLEFVVKIADGMDNLTDGWIKENWTIFFESSKESATVIMRNKKV